MKGKNFRRLFQICVVVFLLSVAVCHVYAAEAKYHAKRFNVVFVIDASGSMKDTDPYNWRFDAINLFLGLSANEGNNIGAIIFNDGIVDEIAMEELSGNSEKTAFSDNLRAEPVSGNTNIGTALLEAVKMMDKYGNRELPSAIILLTDGNTDLGSADEYQQAEEDKNQAIEAAATNHYSVYSVCLNKDGSADTSEMKELSEDSERTYEEVRKAEDLKGVFMKFYNMIYGTETITLLDTAIPESGDCEEEFDVPLFGVEEVNIIISTLDSQTQYEIKPPQREALTAEELSETKISAGTFSVIKIIDPDPGVWKIIVRGIPGDNIKITMVYNSDYQVRLENEGETLNKDLGEIINLEACLSIGDEQISDAQVYQEYPAVLLVSVDGEPQRVDMNAQADEYTAEYKLEDYGTYVFQVSMPIEGMSQISQELTVQVENHAPQAAQEEVDWNIRKWSFGEKTYIYDLTTLVTDQEDDVLAYDKVGESGTEDMPLQATITPDGELRLTGETNSGSILKRAVTERCSVTVRATDSQKEYCEITVNVSLVAMNLLLGRILVCIVVGGALLALILFWRSRHRKFNGEITIAAFDNLKGIYGRSKTIAPSRGKIVLSDFIQDDCGIVLRKTWIQATGKDYIYLKSSKKYYSLYEKQSKKIRLDDSIEVVISNNEELNSGIRVTYHYNGSRTV